ncbi:hypothetical protein [Fundidesulfovibrio agrisoli]|uniref:hypothetical protein n=1 Tax=Fundidesulfovibrio agrisoli TaxID=2922717 RepID=UPI001FAE3A3D|nr:hypothetical protein [Fundidesulfovibrio agrisoli]
MNRSTGVWKDFATGEGGGDIISLYAAVRGVGQVEAAEALACELGVDATKHAKPTVVPRRRVVASYDYHGADGGLVFQVTRWEPKNFTQRRPDGRGGWINSVKGIELVPYHLPEVLKADAVFIVEGEKDADALKAVGLVGTCNAQGAGKWRPEYSSHFIGKRVCILPDNDDPGRKHAQAVAQALHGVAALVKVVELPGLPPKGDVSDWLANGGTREGLLALAKAASEWEPQTSPQASEQLPVILIRDGHLADLVDACEGVLSQPDLPTEHRIFQRGGQLWRVGNLPAASSQHGIARPQGAVVLRDVQKPFIQVVLAKHARFDRYDGRSNDWRQVNPPAAVADAILARSGLWPFPALRGVVACPTIRPDGSLVLAQGHDAGTGYYVAHNLTVNIPDKPTIEDAAFALSLLRELLAGFSFVNNVDRSVALSLILTAIARPALDFVPLFSITAPVRGSGKSTLMDIAAVLATGRRSAVLSATSDADELDKRLAGCLLGGDPIINLDNINGVLGSDLLCQAITSETVKVRPLGTSGHVEIPNTALFSANGNNLTLAGDLSRRALLCRLDPCMERPEERVFDFDPVVEAMKNREQYVSAALVIIRGYLAAGKPEQPLTPFGSFSMWAGLVRNALVWAGEPDPCESRAAIIDDDPEASALRELLNAWWELFGRTPRSIKEVAQTAANSEDSPLAEVLDTIAGERGDINTRKFGKWLKRNSGRVVDGMKIGKFAQTLNGSAQWQVLNVQN